MAATIVGKKDQREVDKFNQRQNNFYSQTLEENRARLDAKFPTNPDLVAELHFIESDMILRGPV